MALNIKDPETEKLAAEVAAMTGENKTKAIRTALSERKERLSFRVVRQDRLSRLRRFLEEEAWPQVPRSVRRKRTTKNEVERILGFGREGF